MAGAAAASHVGLHSWHGSVAVMGACATRRRRAWRLMMLLRARHHLYIYLRLQLVHLRVAFEYPANFWIASVAMLIGELTTIGFTWVLFSHVPQIAGWQFWEVLFLYA